MGPVNTKKLKIEINFLLSTNKIIFAFAESEQSIKKLKKFSQKYLER